HQSGLGLIISTRGLSLSLLCQGSGQKDPEHPLRSLLELPSREIRRCANLRRGAQFVMKAKEKGAMMIAPWMREVRIGTKPLRSAVGA
ncbi:hypothetical protein ACTVMJ_14935, partial [Serratia marcescens]